MDTRPGTLLETFPNYFFALGANAPAVGEGLLAQTQ